MGTAVGVYVVRDLGSLRTGIVEGKTKNTGGSAADELTRYCRQIANSMVTSSAWRSDGKGGPDHSESVFSLVLVDTHAQLL